MILIVDDNPNSRRWIVQALAGSGYSTLEAASGEEALELAGRERPELVVTEVLLPMISGYEVCRALKQRYGPGLPMILVAGRRTHPAYRAAGLLIGADDYMLKPVHPGELLARVRRLLPTHASGRRLDLLTPREREVVTLLAAGLNHADITQRLVITPRTVSKHIEHILAKLGVHSRAEAVAVVLRDETPGAGRTKPAHGPNNATLK